ncbi:relaxase domain-containing protein [Burkholderia cenocepacia]|uniref:MobF family relaxase n=1 Tax=Burkholderia cenocepacia TaxID=95486 RepID=UPI001CF5E6E9|nr:MobF family relaxase [Burkholderia cenocepacia]MCA7967342.1 relaxase domain-containing protein [Burkholderia cenocepacia]
MLTTHQLGTISPKGGNMKYYANVQYYQQNGQDADLSFWHGDGAAAMGLGSGPVNMKIAELLSTGVGKNGERCENAGVTEGSNAHRIGTDFTFSVPKSVSLAWLAADDEERMRIWHEDVFPAVRAALDEIEEHAYTIGPNGERDPAKMIFSCHPHLDSRDGDVQLHVHSVGYNMAQKTDGSWGTVRNDAILTKNRIKTIGAGFRNELALNMQQNGGYAFVREPYKNAKGRENGDIYPEVKGVEKKVREIYSKRSKAIGVAMDAGLSKERANLYTRKAKTDRTYAEFVEQEYGSLEPLITSGRMPSSAQLKAMGSVQNDLVPRDDPAILDQLHENEAFFNRSDLERRIANEHAGLLRIADVKAEVQHFLERNADSLVALAPDEKGRERWVDRRLLDKEHDLKRWANEMKGHDARYAHDASTIDAAIHAFEKQAGFALKDEQRAAAHHVLTNRLSLIEGWAGAGKTTVQKVIVAADRQAGIVNIGMSSSWQAAGVLSKDAGIPAFAAMPMLNRLTKYEEKKIERRAKDAERKAAAIEQATAAGKPAPAWATRPYTGPIGRPTLNPRLQKQWAAKRRTEDRAKQADHDASVKQAARDARLIDPANAPTEKAPRPDKNLAKQATASAMTWTRATAAQNGSIRLDNLGESLDGQRVRILWDELGMASTAETHRLMTFAARYGWAVEGLGDTLQIQPVGAGAPMKSMRDEIGAAYLKNINRQKNEEDLKTSKAFYGDGKGTISKQAAVELLDRLREQGNVVEADSVRRMVHNVTEQWIKSPTDERERIVHAQTHTLVNLLNASIHDAKREQGELTGPDVPLDINDAQGERKTVAMAVGDRIRFTDKPDTFNIPSLKPLDGRIVKKMEGVVLGIEPAGERGHLITVRTETDKDNPTTNNQIVQFHTADFRDFNHGYAMTTTATQGMTREEVWSVGTNNKQGHLVGATRHTGKQEQQRAEAENRVANKMLHVHGTEDDLKAFVNDVTNDGLKLNALDLTVEAVAARQVEQCREATPIAQKDIAAMGSTAQAQVHPGKPEAVQALVKDYLASGQPMEQRLIVAMSERERQQVNVAVRAGLRADGRLFGDDQAVTTRTGEVKPIAAGDMIRLDPNDAKTHAMTTTTPIQITAIERDADDRTWFVGQAHTGAEQSVDVRVPADGAWEHAYALTPSEARGVDRQDAFALLSDKGLNKDALLDAEHGAQRARVYGSLKAFGQIVEADAEQTRARQSLVEKGEAALAEAGTPGTVDVRKTERDAIRAAAEAWTTSKEPEADRLVVATTRGKVAQINDAIREQRREAGLLAREETPVALAGSHGSETVRLAAGDRIAFTSPAAKRFLGVDPAAAAVVNSVRETPTGQHVLTATIDHSPTPADVGKEVRIDLTKFNRLTLDYARTPNEAKAVGDRSHTVYLMNDKANSPDDMKRLQQRTTTFRVIASEPAMQMFVKQAAGKATAEKAVIESDRNAALIEQGRRQAVERQQQHEAAERQRQQAEAQRQARETALAREGARRAAEQTQAREAARRIGRSME